MKEERRIVVEGIPYMVVISDEKQVLLAAKAVGRACIGFESRSGLDLGPALYVVEAMEALEDSFLEQVVRRTYKLPWRITSTSRLFVREFQAGDERQVLREETDTEADKIFYTADRLSQYIQYQYGFYEYGLWALVEKDTGKLVGKAGITHVVQAEDSPKPQAGLCLELGYHIFRPYRHNGYAKEACKGILELLKEKAPRPYWVYAKIPAANQASIRVALSCGLVLTNQKYSEAEPQLCLYAGCWR